MAQFLFFCHLSFWWPDSSTKLKGNTMAKVRVSYQTIEFGETDIHICTLRDKNQFSDPDGTADALGISSAMWPIFGVVWPAGLVLAHHMADYDIRSKRILEIGCGIGLSSLVLNERGADITATDQHPEAEQFLLRNTELNNAEAIKFERNDWADDTSSIGMFDLIIGSDLLYEDEQIEMLVDYISRHAKQKSDMILVDPGRGRKNKMIKRMAACGYSVLQEKPITTDYLEEAFKGHILTFSR